AFSRSDSDPQADEGPGATPASEDAVDSFTLVGDQSDMYSDTSSRSAKCFLPNTALHGLDGHLRAATGPDRSLRGGHALAPRHEEALQLRDRGCLPCPSLTAWQYLHWRQKAKLARRSAQTSSGWATRSLWAASSRS
ncbi:unnamed protein product, partial [Effrenium voratum]